MDSQIASSAVATVSLDERRQLKVKPRVVYVMGAGRSGSTVLGVTLGNCPGIFYAGELDAWLRKKGVSNFEGEERAVFWRKVAGEVSEGAELFGEGVRQNIEHSSAIFRRARAPRDLRRHYREIAEKLYQAVSKASGETSVVDTSHYPLRAREMQKISSIDLYLIYLVRKPSSVVTSFSKRDVDQPAQSPFRANVYLYLTHLLSTLVFLSQPRERRLLVRYEEFSASPEKAVARLLDWLGTADPCIPDLSKMNTGVAFQGNRLLRSENIEFRRESLDSSRTRPLTDLVQLPWTVFLSRMRPALAQSLGSVDAPGL